MEDKQNLAIESPMTLMRVVKLKIIHAYLALKKKNPKRTICQFLFVRSYHMNDGDHVVGGMISFDSKTLA